MLLDFLEVEVVEHKLRIANEILIDCNLAKNTHKRIVGRAERKFQRPEKQHRVEIMQIGHPRPAGAVAPYHHHGLKTADVEPFGGVVRKYVVDHIDSPERPTVCGGRLHFLGGRVGRGDAVVKISAAVYRKEVFEIADFYFGVKIIHSRIGRREYHRPVSVADKLFALARRQPQELRRTVAYIKFHAARSVLAVTFLAALVHLRESSKRISQRTHRAQRREVSAVCGDVYCQLFAQ